MLFFFQPHFPFGLPGSFHDQLGASSASSPGKRRRRRRKESLCLAQLDSPLLLLPLLLFFLLFLSFSLFLLPLFFLLQMVGTLQLPRLTAALRESHRGGTATAPPHTSPPTHLSSIESIYLASQDLLKQKQARPLDQEDSEFVESVTSSCFFFLHYFFFLHFLIFSRHEKEIWGKLSALDKAEDSKKRQLFRQYLKKVKELVGEQSDPAQTSSSAVFLFKTLTDLKGSEASQSLFFQILN